MTDIRKALGDEAIIVSTRRNAKGTVEVIAAVESASAPPPLDPFAPATAAEFEELPIFARFRRLHDGKADGDSPAEALPPAAEAAEAVPPATEEMARFIQARLEFHRVPVRQARQFVRAASAFSTDAPVEALARALSTVLRFMPLPDRPQRSFMLVGPPGSGKTVATAKLAARAAVAGSPLRVISCDTLKAGATAQLEAYLRALDQPLGVAASPAELERLENGGRVNRPSVIDTPGTNPFDDTEMENLIRFVAAVNVEPILVLAAGCDAHDAIDVSSAFVSKVGVRRMIVTRLDGTRRLGSIVAAAEGTGIAIAEVSASPYVGQGLRPIDSNEIASLLMQDNRSDAGETVAEAAQ